MNVEPRDLWSPVLGWRYGIRPWEMADFTPDELNEMIQLHNELAKKGIS